LNLQPTLSPFSSVSTITSNLVNPLTHQWNLDIQRSLPGSFILTAAYVGTRGEHLFVNKEFNPFLNNPNFGFVGVRTNGGDSIYHSGQLQIERPFKHGLLLRGAYTYSKFIDDQSEVFVTSGGSSRSQDILNQSSDRGLSAFDRRHRFTLAYLYELPYVHDRSNAFMTALNAITSGWQTTGILTFSTGAPETVHDGLDINGDGLTTTARIWGIHPHRSIPQASMEASSASRARASTFRWSPVSLQMTHVTRKRRTRFTS